MAKYQQPLNTDINDRLTSAEYDSELQKWVTVSKDIQAIDKLQEVKNRLDQQLEVKDDNVLSKLADLETKLQAIEDRLNGVLDMQLTGSIVTQPTPVGYSYEDKSVIVPNPVRGMEFFELDTEIIYIYDGSAWVVSPI